MKKTKAVFEVVQDKLLEDLIRGVYKPGEAVPDRDELRRIFRTNRETIDRALQQMEAGGLIDQADGQLTFTRDHDLLSRKREEIALAYFGDFLEKAGALGMDKMAILRMILNKGGLNDQARG